MGEQGHNSTVDDDARIVARARADSAAFAELYRRYIDAVYRYCRIRLGTREQAEDATSQVFLKALSALPSHREGGSFRAWLFTIAHNVVTDCYRARRVHSPLTDASEQPDRGPSPEQEAVDAVERDELRAMLDLLPTDQQRVMELRLAGLTGGEIAEALGKNLGAIKMAQSRAIARLKAAHAGAISATPEETLHVQSR